VRLTLLLLAAMGMLLFVLLAGCARSGHKQNVEAANNKRPTDSKSEVMSDGCLGKLRTWKDISFSPNGKKIAFTSVYQEVHSGDPGSDICMINADGTGMVRLTDDPRQDMFPTWSPDGRHLAFIRALPEDYGTNFVSAVVVMAADGSHEKELPGTKHRQPEDAMSNDSMRPLDWSPSGEEIAYSSASCDIYIKPADGSGAASKLSRNPNWGCTKDPAWSPDGKRLAFGGDFGIYVKNLSDGSRDTEQVRRVAGGRGFTYHTPTWSPDGTEIAFDKNDTSLYKVNAGGSGETNLDSFGWSPNWLPDGNHIAFLRWVCGGSGCDKARYNAVYEMDPDGSERTIVDQLPKGAPYVNRFGAE
jgi:Tol biopolymer transport system component